MLRWIRKVISTANDYRISYHRVSPIVAIIMFLITIALLLVIFWFTQIIREGMIRYNRRVMDTYAKLW